MDRTASREENASLLLAERFSLIEATLVTTYGVPRAEATRLGQELCEWFDRLARRPGSPASLQGLRSQLLSMVCKVGHVYWAGKMDGTPPSSETVKRTLALGPEVIAIEIENRLLDSDRDTSP